MINPSTSFFKISQLGTLCNLGHNARIGRTSPVMSQSAKFELDKNGKGGGRAKLIQFKSSLDDHRRGSTILHSSRSVQLGRSRTRQANLGAWSAARATTPPNARRMLSRATPSSWPIRAARMGFITLPCPDPRRSQSKSRAT